MSRRDDELRPVEDRVRAELAAWAGDVDAGVPDRELPALPARPLGAPRIVAAAVVVVVAAIGAGGLAAIDTGREPSRPSIEAGDDGVDTGTTASVLDPGADLGPTAVVDPAAGLATGWRHVEGPFGGGVAQQVVAFDGRLLAAVRPAGGGDVAVWASDDHGATWAAISTIPEAALVVRLVTAGGTVVAYGQQPLGSKGVWVSTDGTGWTFVQRGILLPDDLTVGPDGYVAIGERFGGGPTTIWTSPDGFVWEEIPPAAAGSWPEGLVTRIAVTPGRWVVTHLHGTWSSSDGRTWSPATTELDPSWDHALVALHDRFVAVGPTIRTSHDGSAAEWFDTPTPRVEATAGAAAGPSGVVVSWADATVVSPDGATWLVADVAGGASAVAADGAGFVVAGGDVWTWAPG